MCVWGGGLCLSMYVGVSLNFAYVWGVSLLLVCVCLRALLVCVCV